MAELLEVELGDRLVLTSSTADSKEIVQELFRLSGLFEFGPESLDENLIFINLHKAQSLFELPGAAHQIAIRFNRPEMANDPTLNIYKSFNNDQTEANGWLALQPTMGAMLEMTGYSTLIVGGILFLLASLGIINSMFMSIYERIYEFGVIKSVGTRPAEIIKLILTEAFFLALISCFFGIILGYFISSYFSTNGIPMGRMEMSGIVLDGNMNTILEPYQFINFPIYVTLLTLIAAIYPALFASKIVPTEALQKAL
jgi:ABC-type lipoprotein release transport system permease subunit